MDRNPILCLDFDGVLHSYSSGWKGADVIPDPPVPGAMEFIYDATNDFEVHIFSSRSHQPGGINAMQKWLHHHMFEHLTKDEKEHVPISSRFIIQNLVYFIIEWPTVKPPAKVSIDDRGITFDGTFPSIQELLAFEPWNKR